jgi:ligand-binding sensor domain-containing protein
MVKVCFLVFTTLTLTFCHSQTRSNSTKEQGRTVLTELQKGVPNGIVYFSYDNGSTWVNSSKGLPEKVRIGLGGIATSSDFLGVATKENGVYNYNFMTKTWENIPTDKQIIEANIGAISCIDSTIYVGTQFKGVFCTKNKGETWTNLNSGLTNLTIRRFCEFNKMLYVCTNDGFYSLNKISNNWHLEFGQSSLQTNGATVFKGRFYLATNKGVFTQLSDKSWVNSSPQFSMHNISADQNQINAMTYNELLLASSDGQNWQKQQNGLPKDLYTFNVLNHNNVVFAGQWDGVYRKNNSNKLWELSSKGLPPNFAVTNLKAFDNILIISTSERKL